ncbi:unnamed protein product [Urochloa decumbens]|uniref:F-box protein n=1 Tax=Urochloa decumbens TaxID=240449 RepID=A0ABC9DYB5_9POAL
MPNSVVLDHCNGLLLLYDYVLNPATGRCATLPDRPSPGVGMEYFIEDTYLAFDPTVSSHYEVFLIPSVPRKCPLDREVERVGSAMLRSEWPPSPWILSVFSSRTGLWEERSFIREGEAAGTVADMQLDWRYLPSRHAEYWRGALYVHCQADFVMRLSLSNGTYRVIKPSRGIEMFQGQEFHLGRSEKGIYFALLDDKLRMWVWILEESCEQIEWKLRHCSEQELAFPRLSSDHGPWVLSNVKCDDETEDDDDDDQEAVEKQEFDWKSDDDNNILHTGDKVDRLCNERIQILAFHPYKEIIFLQRSLRRGLTYYLNSSKLEDLGNLFPNGYYSVQSTRVYITGSFPYTPCWMGELPEIFE